MRTRQGVIAAAAIGLTFACAGSAFAQFPGLTDLSADLTDFGETAAVIANLDLVITVDTAIGHLTGAMGRPVWILLPRTSDWRWLLDRADSPWYPTMKLYRQQHAGDWAPVFAQMAADLERLLR